MPAVALHHLGHLVAAVVGRVATAGGIVHPLRHDRVLLVDHLVRGVQPVASGGEIVAEVPAPEGGHLLQPLRIVRQGADDAESQRFKFFAAQPSTAHRQFEPQPLGQIDEDALVVEEAQSLHVGGGQVGDAVADGGVGEIGGIVAVGDVRVGAQVLEHPGAVVVKITDDGTVALDPGPQHHHLLVAVGQVRVVGHGLEQLEIIDHRPGHTVYLLVAEADRLTRLVLHQPTAGLGQPDQFLGVG